MTDGHHRVGTAFLLLQSALNPFVIKHLQAKLGSGWRVAVSWPGGVETPSGELDAYACLKTMIDRWQTVFKPIFKGNRNARNLVGVALDIRNRHSHPVAPFDDFAALDALSTLSKVLELIGARDAHDKVRELWTEQRQSGASHGASLAPPPPSKPEHGQPSLSTYVFELRAHDNFRRIYYGPVLLTKANLRGLATEEALAPLQGLALNVVEVQDDLLLTRHAGSPPCALDGRELKEGEPHRIPIGNHVLQIASFSLDLTITTETQSD